MPSNTLQTIWKLILDEQSARKSEDAIQQLARTVQDKLGTESTAAIDKTTEALKRQEDQAKKTGEATQKASLTETAGRVGGAAGKLRGVASLVGGGEFAGLVNDIGDAVEGFQALKAALTGVEAAQAGATAAQTAAGAAATTAAPGFFASAAGLAAMIAPLLPFIAIGAAVAAAVVAINNEENKRAEALRKEMDIIRGINDEIAAGATKEDIQAQIDLLNYRNELEQVTLEDSKKKYDDYIQSVRDAAGGLGALLEPFIRLFGNYEEELASQVDKSQKLIDENNQKENAYDVALERGLTAKNDAKKAEEELAQARDKSNREAEQAAAEQQREAEKQAREREAAQKKAQADQERAAQEQQRQAEQFRQKQEQIEQKRYDAAQKYGDAMVDIATKAADDAKAAAVNLRNTLSDNQQSFLQDIHDLSIDFAASEREEAIARQEEEAADLRQHAQKLAGIRDDALNEETDLLRKRDFLGATRVRENANRQIEQENRALVDAQQEKLRLQQQENAQQLRELDKARRDRLTALQRANEDARLAYQRDLQTGREARRIAERDAAIARDRDLRAASEMARALLGIHQQTNSAIVQLGQGMLNQLRGFSGMSSSVTNNNQRTVNGGINFNSTATNPQMLRQQVIQVLGSVGLA